MIFSHISQSVYCFRCFLYGAV